MIWDLLTHLLIIYTASHDYQRHVSRNFKGKKILNIHNFMDLEKTGKICTLHNKQLTAYRKGATERIEWWSCEDNIIVGSMSATR